MIPTQYKRKTITKRKGNIFSFHILLMLDNIMEKCQISTGLLERESAKQKTLINEVAVNYRPYPCYHDERTKFCPL
jgi:hypothetical protein